MVLTSKIMEACKSIDVRVVDHIIIGGMKYYSFNEVFKVGRDISSLSNAINHW
ncbi:MAG: JAB domain-containing protein [Janthinobacterium lividum]